MRFADRTEAGRRLAVRLGDLGGADLLVTGLPNGGVPVAAEVAAALGAPLDVILVRKLGAPYQPELAVGAIGEGDVRVLDEEVLRRTGAGPEDLARVEVRERAELERRSRRYRGDRPAAEMTGRTVVIVDDGIATGSTALAACRVARARGAARIVVAAPVAPAGVELRLLPDADAVICLDTPPWFRAVGEFYDDFRHTSDDEVARLLEAARS